MRTFNKICIWCSDHPEPLLIIVLINILIGFSIPGTWLTLDFIRKILTPTVIAIAIYGFMAMRGSRLD